MSFFLVNKFNLLFVLRNADEFLQLQKEKCVEMIYYML